MTMLSRICFAAGLGIWLAWVIGGPRAALITFGSCVALLVVVAVALIGTWIWLIGVDDRDYGP